jgi:hypothetical protein
MKMSAKLPPKKTQHNPTSAASIIGTDNVSWSSPSVAPSGFSGGMSGKSGSGGMGSKAEKEREGGAKDAEVIVTTLRYYIHYT